MWGIWLPCTSQQHVMIVFWQASAREDKSAIVEMGSPGREQDKSPCCQHVHSHNGLGRLPRKNSGGTFYGRIQRAPFWCNTNSEAPLMQKTKSKSTNNIRIYTRNHPSQIESTDRRHARNDFLLITTNPNHNSPRNIKQKIQIGLSTAISATHWCPRVKLLKRLSVTNPILFMTFPNCLHINRGRLCIPRLLSFSSSTRLGRWGG